MGLKKVVALGAALVALGVVTTPVVAKTTAAKTTDVLISGSVVCGGPTEVVAGLGVDCSVSLAEPLSSGVSVVAVDSEGQRTRCRSTEDALVCAEVGAGLSAPGEQAVRLLRVSNDGEEIEVGTGSFTTSDSADHVVGFDADEPVVFDGRPLQVSTTLAEPVPGLFLVVRERGGAETVAVVGLEPPLDPNDLPNNQSVAIDLPTGRYRAWPCVGFYPETCLELSGGHPFQVLSTEVVPLLPGHNRPSAERINVLFAASGFDSAELPDLARATLGWNGPSLVGTDLFYGPMAIEPLKTSRDRFNFWILPAEVADEAALFSDGSQADRLASFDLPNLQVTTFYSADGPTEARTTSFYGRYEVPESSRIAFGGVRLVIDLEAPETAAPTLAHEWGHGLFDLRDEYDAYDERDPLNRYPNCAPDESSAQNWWGDEVGDVDPFVYDVIEAREDAGLRVDTYDQPLVELVRIGIVPGGCLGDQGVIEGYRPSVDSLMNSQLPVFGTVNRRRVEEVLAQFSGRGPIESPDDLVVSCVSKEDVMTCEGRLRSYLDPPESGIDIGGVGCTFETTVDPVGVMCEGPAPAEDFVTVFIGAERGRVVVVNVDPPPVDPPPLEPSDATSLAGSAREVEADALVAADSGRESEATGSMVRFWTVVAISVGAAGVLFGLGRRSSRN